MNAFLKVPDLPARSWDFVGNMRLLSGVLDVALERTADEVARAEANCKSKGKNDSAEQNSKRQLDDISSYLQMVEHHGRSENKNQPLHAQQRLKPWRQACRRRITQRVGADPAWNLCLRRVPGRYNS